MALAGRHFTIRTRLFVLVGAATLPLVLLLVAHGVSEYRDAREASVERARAVAQYVAVRIDSYLSSLGSTLAILAERPGVKALDPAACDPALADYVSLHPQFTTFVVRRADSSLVCSSRTDSAPRLDAVRFPWFEGALRAGRFSATGAFVDPHTGRHVTVLTHPVRGASGEIAGLIVLPLDLEALGTRMLTSLADDILVGVLDHEDRYLVRSRRGAEFTGKPVAPTWRKRSTSNRRDDSRPRVRTACSGNTPTAPSRSSAGAWPPASPRIPSWPTRGASSPRASPSSSPSSPSSSP